MAVVLVLLVLSALVFRLGQHPVPVRYRTAIVEHGSIESRVSATGTVRPVVQVEVGSQVSGTVERLFADYHSRVKRGQVLLQIEPSTFGARVLEAEAATARAEAALKEARRQLARAQELIQQKYIAQADLDATQATVDGREADVKQAHAQLEAARLDLDHTTIRAPIDGVVISRSMGTITTLTPEDAAAIKRECPTVEAVAPGVRTVTQLVWGDQNWSTQVQGTSADFVVVRQWPLTSGVFLSDADVRGAAKVCVLGSKVTQQLYGSTDPIGTLVRIKNIPFRVIGVLAFKGGTGFGGDQDDVFLGYFFFM